MTALYVPLSGDYPSSAQVATYVPLFARKSADSRSRRT